MKNYDENEESSYIQYLDANNLYGWAMCQKLPVNGFKWVNNEINEEFIKNYDENSDKRYILEVDVKGALSGLRQFLAIESPLKMMKNAFCFISKVLFVLRIFKYLS